MVRSARCFRANFARVCWPFAFVLTSGAPTFGGEWAWLLRNIDANRHPDPELVGPGKGWNYPDMLEVGVPGGLNETEERTQTSMWAMMASPLILGNDVFKMSPYTRETLLNHEVIAVDQDAQRSCGCALRVMRRR